MKNKQKSTDCCQNRRLNKVGGQAVLEGVMMKAGSRVVTTCRKEDGTLAVNDSTFSSVRKKHKILNIPILRGVINFFEMMALSVKTLGASADAMGLDETENPGKVEKWLSKKLGISITDIVMVISVILGLALSVFLFLFLPIWTTAGINFLLYKFGSNAMGPVLTAVVEGIIKLGIFIAYLALVSLMRDIKRTFMYHGAEHKSIACFESGDELTPENAKKHTRFHPRCGTSFMFFMILLGIFAGIIIKTTIPGLPTWLYTVIRLLILPLVMGMGYEIIMLAGKHDNIVTRILSAPGLWVQRITTKEPDEDMLEVAIVSIKCALRDEYPEFKEFFESEAWKPVVEENTNSDDNADNGGAVCSDAEGEATDTENVESASKNDTLAETKTKDASELGDVSNTTEAPEKKKSIFERTNEITAEILKKAAENAKKSENSDTESAAATEEKAENSDTPSSVAENSQSLDEET